jgi:hypothetical protein
VAREPDGHAGDGDPRTARIQRVRSPAAQLGCRAAGRPGGDRAQPREQLFSCETVWPGIRRRRRRCPAPSRASWPAVRMTTGMRDAGGAPAPSAASGRPPSAGRGPSTTASYVSVWTSRSARAPSVAASTAYPACASAGASCIGTIAPRLSTISTRTLITLYRVHGRLKRARLNDGEDVFLNDAETPKPIIGGAVVQGPAGRG